MAETNDAHSALKPQRRVRVGSIAGLRFGRLVAIEEAPGPRNWRCVCDCGAEAIVRKNNLRSGNTTSCGCWRREARPRLTHGLTDHPLYDIWYEMMQRCHREDDPKYHYYGGRGIVVCDRWHDVRNFVADLKDRPDGLTIDRIDVNGNYEPGNVRWATRKQQQRNRRCNRLVDIDGDVRTLIEWSEISAVSYTTIAHRLHRGWSPYDAVFTPPNRPPIKHERPKHTPVFVDHGVRTS
jgi:hypothetical protein